MNIQHGDVLIKGISELPEGCKKQSRKGRLVVMAGEQTGHHHAIKEKTASIWTLEKNGITQMYLEVTDPVTITHEEHKPLEIPEGIYEIGQVREFDYLQQMERNVID